MVITSTQNPLIKQLRALHTAKGRQGMGAYLLEGRKVVAEALHTGHLARCLLIEESMGAAELTELAQQKGIEIHQVSQRVMEALSDTVTPQGVIAVMPIPQPPALSEVAQTGELIIILERMQDPGNLGTIIRTAVAVDASAIVLSMEGCDPYAPKVIRACMGSHLHIPIYRSDDLRTEIEILHDEQYSLAATILQGENFLKRNYERKKIALIIGNEASGISPALVQMADLKWRLPIVGGAESLNAAVAAGIFLYELSRHKLDMVE